MRCKRDMKDKECVTRPYGKMGKKKMNGNSVDGGRCYLTSIIACIKNDEQLH